MKEKHIRVVKLKNKTVYEVRFCVNYKDIYEGRFDTLKQAIKHRDSVYPKYGIILTTSMNGDLTLHDLKQLVHYDPKTGVFTRKNRSSNAKVGDKLGGLQRSSGYIVISINSKQYKAHRLAYLYMTGRIPKNIDHINGNKQDNRWVNLRGVCQSENSKNQQIRRNSKYRVMGVSKDKNSWKAYIQSDINKTKYVYCGPDFFEACCARKSAERYYNYHENHGRAA